MEWKDNDVRYFRYNSSNIPGIFDYTCPFSRASWGCVKTAYNVSHAKLICTQDPVCKAFVILSGEPDEETLLTVIFKNSSKSTIHRNTGATFFIKVSSLLGSRRKSNNHQAPMTTVVHGFNVVDCVSRSQSVHQTARNIREKRLRHHIGLRGITESQWLTMMRHATLDRAFDMSSTGQFLLNLHWTDLSELISPEKGAHMGTVVFKGQQNSKSSYVGSMIVYKLDRLLGLYHTPPVSKMVLTAATLQVISKNKQHLQQLQDLAGVDGSIEGFVQPPQPSSFTVQSITLRPLDQLTDQLNDISKADKLFLEYVLLIWLTKIKLNNNHYIGTKGHVILLNGDRAFTEFKPEWLKYFNHCRFPNIVYKILACFRCNPPPGKIPSVPVCGLGEQVFTELQHDGVYMVDVYRKSREQIMNSAAADLLNVVDLCIQKHGRKHVLY
ncbi:uncharacterized protein LOC115231021 [Octopus sinensis]|uniref:Uncharacterized protein LOC115231021 n=1 Tax=Octopus sinensis TaxID=2607531 RepID=A0A6P7TYV4_9MOLL|nr:uncharacterized protein LOC115231021 [Octopus sinensis]